MQVQIVNHSKQTVQRAKVRSWALNVWKELLKRKIVSRGQPSDLVIAFVEPEYSQKLNKKYRGKNRPTDVLSFSPVEHGNPEVGSHEVGSGELGELVLCLSVIKKQAKDHRHSVEKELGYMLLHGILHLLGYDHEKSDKEAREMYRLQDSIFATLGSSNVTSHRIIRRQKSSSKRRRKSH